MAGDWTIDETAGDFLRADGTRLIRDQDGRWWHVTASGGQKLAGPFAEPQAAGVPEDLAERIA